MWKGFPWVLGVWLIAAVPLSAQELFPPVPNSTNLPAFPGGTQFVDPPRVPPVPVMVDLPPEPPTDGLHFWAQAEFLVWWVKNAPQPFSVVTTDSNGNTGGNLVDSDVNYKATSGLRFSFGGWVGQYNNIGVEGSFFTLGRQSTNTLVSSDNNGSPGLALPFNNTTPGTNTEYILPISDPGKYAGNVLIASTLELWGTEFNGVMCLWRQPNLEFSLLMGFRYLDLRENLNLSAVTTSLDTGAVTALNDNFYTRNQFYGGQIGSQFLWKGERLSVDIVGKIAFGATHQVVDIEGNSAQFGSNTVNGTLPGGLYAQQSNMGRSTGNQFSVVPAVEAKFSYYFNPRWRMFVGYDFMYWSQVVRPGSQVDHNVNLSQSPLFGTGTLSGPASPMPQFNRTDFWAQGISLGLEFRF